MKYFEVNKLKEIVLAPWIEKAMALIGKERRVGGNQFRHMMNTMTILLDYKIVDPIMLKAAVIHDLIEDIPETDINSLRCIDSDSDEVIYLVLQVTKKQSESKKDFLLRILEKESERAKILKIADRISNLTDLHRTIFKDAHYLDYIEDTVDYVIPMTKAINGDSELGLNMRNELVDLIIKRLNVRKDNIFSLARHLLKLLLSRRARNIYDKIIIEKPLNQKDSFGFI